MIAIPESVRAAQLASIHKLGKRLQDSMPEESCCIDLVPEAFSCAICHDLFIKPRQCFPCRHFFCEPCLRQLADSDIHRDAVYCPCPLCRGPIHYSRPDKSLETEILRSSSASLYAERSQSYACNSEMQAKPLPGLAVLSFLPSVSPSYRRINRVLPYITFALLWLSSKSTRPLLLDWFLLRTLEAQAGVGWLLPTGAAFLLLASMFVRITPLLVIRFIKLIAFYCSAHMLPGTCPAPNFPEHLLQVRLQLAGYAMALEAYVCIALFVFSVCITCGPLLRRYGGFSRLGDAISFVVVCGMCACALLSLLCCVTSLLFAMVALISAFLRVD